MNTILLTLVLTTGLSEAMETRLPSDPHMIYTASFSYEGSKVSIDWRDRSIVAGRVCRKASTTQKRSCEAAAMSWLAKECRYYKNMNRPSAKQRDMQNAVCKAHGDLSQLIEARAVAAR